MHVSQSQSSNQVIAASFVDARRWSLNWQPHGNVTPSAACQKWLHHSSQNGKRAADVSHDLQAEVRSHAAFPLPLWSHPQFVRGGPYDDDENCQETRSGRVELEAESGQSVDEAEVEPEEEKQKETKKKGGKGKNRR